MFKRQKTKIKKPGEAREVEEVNGKIHVMPERFYQPPKTKRSPLILFIILGVIFLAGLIVFAVYLNQSLKTAQKAQISLNEPLNININEALLDNENTNSAVNVNTNVPPVDLNLNIRPQPTTTPDLNTNLNTNTDIEVALPQTLQPLPTAPDVDHDGLTAAEEGIFGTNPEVSDTDSDTYSDGAELLAGYDPARPRAQLSSSAIFTFYRHPLYSILYPSSWTVRQQDEQKSEVLFVSSTGEFFEILVINNVNNLALTDWYVEQFPGIDLTRATQVQLNNTLGLRQPDNQSYYLMKNNDQSKIYLLTYNSGNFSELNFLTTFNAVVKSFRVN